MTANYRHPDFFQKRETESQIAYEMRVRPYLHHREDAQADANEAHKEFRAQQESRTQGTGYGLMGDRTPQERAAALGNRGFGSGRPLAKNGGTGGTAVPGSVAIPMVFHSQLHEGGEPAVSPLAAHLRSSGEGWFVR